MNDRTSWKQTGKRIGLYGLYAVLGTITLLAIAAVTPRQWYPPQQQADCKFRIYVSGGIMHTNFFVPVRNDAFDWNQHLNLATLGKRMATEYRYLQFGWGDRRFYIETPSWDKISISSALRSLLLQNPAALFVKGHTTVPYYPNETLKCISLDQTRYLKLMHFLEASFQTNSQGKERISSGHDGDSSFYAATGRYSMFKTCNSWTAEGLRSADVNTPLWGGLAPAVMQQLKDSCECGE